MILVASSNAHKIAEIAALLPEHEVLPYTKFLAPIEILEDGDTFVANAQKKAQGIFVALPQALASSCLVLADDSGLCVRALGGAPGVRSARYAGANADIDNANNAKLVAELQKLGISRSSAYFECAIALCGFAKDSHTMRCATTSGIVEGEVSIEMCGSNGFGYDCLFIPFGFERTFAQMQPNEKNTLSHRFRALQNVRELLQKIDFQY
ncbi:MAG: non-canonical purine NTP pyrophosphatase [Helicobacter sp.]|nr:non-canonical purine NTP pyrophosphatase [Helicobacter sp.]